VKPWEYVEPARSQFKNKEPHIIIYSCGYCSGKGKTSLLKKRRYDDQVIDCGEILEEGGVKVTATPAW
jgi:hypothetical protein